MEYMGNNQFDFWSEATEKVAVLLPAPFGSSNMAFRHQKSKGFLNAKMIGSWWIFHYYESKKSGYSITDMTFVYT